MIFRNEYFFLSNFHPASFSYGGIAWTTSEHAYQAYKTTDTAMRHFISRLERPEEAKFHGKSLEIRDGWLYMRVPVMLSILQAKFFQNKDLAEKLLATGDIPLVESNTWHDNFWGRCSCGRCATATGVNALGLALMEVRRQIASADQFEPLMSRLT